MYPALLCLGMCLALMDVAAWASSTAAPDHPSDALIVADFEARVLQYMALRRDAAQSVPRLRVTDDPDELCAARDALRTSIRRMRADARRGDIFTPGMEALLRRTIRAYLERHNVNDVLAAILEENPPHVSLKPRINAPYPEETSLAPMPGDLLPSLPRLPEELQFRFMNRDLVLWDAYANLVVDFIPKVL
jgi:hypothetical protein